MVIATLIVLVPYEQSRLFRETADDRRREIDSFMKNSPSSPLLDRSVFVGLDYFEPSREYVVKAYLERIDETPVFSVPMTGGTEDLYERFAWASFELLGNEYRLLVLRSLDPEPDNRLFIAFYDETNGDESYFGGRYVDAYLDGTDYVAIDFNRTYNPYCVYDPAYACPIPPFENRLPIRIEAGEKMWHEA